MDEAPQPAGVENDLSPYRRFARDEWARLRADTPLTLTADEVGALQSLNAPVSLDEVIAIYLPLSRLLALYVAAAQGLFKATQRFLLAENEGKRPDILGVEGLNVLQPARLPRDGKAIPFVSDFFDFSIYLDADEDDLHRWYVNRFLRLRHTAFRDPLSYFRKYAELPEAEAIETANGLWTGINLPNLRDNIVPTRQRASLILRKGASHRIEEVALRRL